jgi:hypothetical protein
MVEAGMNAFTYSKEKWMSNWVRGMYLAMLTAAPKLDDERDQRIAELEADMLSGNPDCEWKP